ncbi:MAG: hypothetical protein WBE58_03725 [Verrucomicrobiales bacterium]
MKNLLKLTLITSLFALAGCGKEEQQPAKKPQAEVSNKPAQEMVSEWGTGDHPSQSVGPKYRWNKEKILERHSELAMAPLPSYIEEVWGAGGMPKDSDVLSDWAFVVPEERIGDFQDYLSELGVPEEYMEGDSPYRVSERENWVRPNPPAERLNFLMAETLPGGGQRRGLDFGAGQTRFYRFENPNLERSELHIRFDPVTGNTHVEERYIGW